MSEHEIKFTGWKAIVAAVVLMGVLGVRLMTFNDKKDDDDLMRQIEVQLISDYFPNEVEKLKAVYETGDMDEMEEVAKSVTSAKLNIESVQASFPLFDFTTPKDVVVKVTYSLIDVSGARDRVTNYYLFQHGLLGSNWRYERETSVISYYLNVL